MQPRETKLRNILAAMRSATQREAYILSECVSVHKKIPSGCSVHREDMEASFNDYIRLISELMTEIGMVEE